MKNVGMEWQVIDTPIQLKETTAPATPYANKLKLYAKDKSSVSALYAMDDAGVEHELTNRVGGTGTANRLAYWTATSTLAAVAALTSTRIPFADTNGLPTDSANHTWDDTNGIVTIKNKASGATLILDSSNAAHNSGVYLKVNASALYRLQIEASTSKLQIFVEGGSASALQFDTNRNTIVGTGAVATNATGPFFFLNSCAGVPTGTPTSITGQVPIVVDTTDNRIYMYNAAWKVVGDATFVSGAGAGVSGQVAYWTGGTTQAGNNNLSWDSANFRLGLGVGLSPSFQFHGQAPDASSFNFTLDTYGTGAAPNYRGRAARGTAALPTALSADDIILAVSGLPYGSAFASGARAQMLFLAGETISGTNQGTYISFKTTPIGGSTTIAERFRIGPAGQWGIGGATFGTSGGVFMSQGASAAPIWSTLILPNSATANRIVYATSSNTWGESANLAYDGTDFLIGSGTRARMSGQNRFRWLNSMAKATGSTDLTISNTTWTVVTWDTESFDTDGLHSTSSNTSRLTIALAGKYLTACTYAYEASTVGSRWISIEKNSNGTQGAGTILCIVDVQAVTDSTFGTLGVAFTIDNLAANDVLEVFTWQDSGGNLKFLRTQPGCSFSTVYLGE